MFCPSWLVLWLPAVARSGADVPRPAHVQAARSLLRQSLLRLFLTRRGQVPLQLRTEGSDRALLCFIRRGQVPLPLRTEGSDRALLCLSWFPETLNLPVHFSSLIPKMSMFTLAISYLTTSNLHWFMDLTFQVSGYCSLQSWTLLPSPVTSTTGHCFRFDSISSFFLELFLYSSSVAYWTLTGLGSSSFSVSFFCLYILFMGFSRDEYWSALPFSSPVGCVLSETSTMTSPSWVALHSMAYSFTELDKAVVHVNSLISFQWLWFGSRGPFEGGGHYLHYLHHSLVSGQITGWEHSPTHQEKIGLKIYWGSPCPSEQDPVSPMVSLSHKEASISLLSLSFRGLTVWKPQSQIESKCGFKSKHNE